MEYFILLGVIALSSITSFFIGRRNGAELTLDYLEKEGYIVYEESSSDSSTSDSDGDSSS